MKITVQWLLLTLSVGFNVFFAIGYVQSKSDRPHHRRFEQRARRVAARLDLDPQQQEDFEKLFAQTLKERANMRQKNEPERERFLSELIKDEPDDQVLSQYAKSEFHQRRREIMVQHMKKFMGMLTSEQRRTFAEVIRTRRARKNERSGRH